MNKNNSNSEKFSVKPFVKWAGGKTQLLNEIENALPAFVKENEFIYVEPFVGGGAVLFYLLQNYPNIKKAIVNDINADLINSYRVIKNNVSDLINILKRFEKEYHSLEPDNEAKKKYYYAKRKQFNKRKNDEILHTALFIFLNKTCFNGLYRVNKKNEFNVPWGSYKKPLICDEQNLLAVSKILNNFDVEFLNSDFTETLQFANEKTFYYLDPPYKPINNTSSFTSYTSEDFTDEDQIRLAQFCETLDKKGASWILSNSDVRTADEKNNFFELLYNNFNIKRVFARRNINSNPNKRGTLTELLISN